MQTMECTIKKIDDYLNALQEQFPDMSKGDIKKILHLAFNFIRKIIMLAGGVRLGNKKTRALIAKKFSWEKSLQRNRGKAAIKARIKWNRGIREFDNYYYFSIPEWKYKKIDEEALKNQKEVYFGNVTLYKSAEECWLKREYNTRFFRVFWPIDCGFDMYKRKFKTNQYEYLGNEREKSSNKWIQQRPEFRSEPDLTTEQLLELLS